MTRKEKQIALILFDVISITLASILSYSFLNIYITLSSQDFWAAVLINVVSYLIFALLFRLYNKINRYTSIRETILHMFVLTISFLLASILAIPFVNTISFRFMLLTYIFSVAVIPGSRVIWRISIEYYEKRKLAGQKYTRKIPTLIVGAGEGGSIYIKSLNRQDSEIELVGIVDDKLSKQGLFLYDVPVLGKISDLPRIVSENNIEQITIAIPSLKKDELERIIELAQQTKAQINRIPSLEKIMTGKYEINELQEIDVIDLLGREEVELDLTQIGKQLNGKKVLVTGAGGSIGSEISRQLIRFLPDELLLLGHSENPIYEIDRELKNKNKEIKITPIIADIRDRERIFQVMKDYQPDMVYHAAAHKHVPLMEYNPTEAVKNNIYGTKNVAEAAKANHVEAFVMISTDKAVNPPNVMGASKRIAEMIVTGLNEAGKTSFVAVRFGNVLGSSGSVIPLFKEQIEKGGPVTVTDFRMTRYFMTIPEASRLVLQAGALAKGGEIFVLDMDEPVKILDLAKKMIQLSGHKEDEIEIVESGIRPGEKLFEQLMTSDEETHQEVYEKIFIGKVENLALEKVMKFVSSLDQLNEEELKKQIVAFANHELKVEDFDE